MKSVGFAAPPSRCAMRDRGFGSVLQFMQKCAKRPVYALLGVAALVAGCSTLQPSPSPLPVASRSSADPVQLIDRITWGANPSLLREVMQQGIDHYLAAQLKPAPGSDLPPAIQAQISAMTIEQQPLATLAGGIDQQRRNVNAIKDEKERSSARQAYQQELARLGREASTRTLLRAVYSTNQLREQMTWFWFDHFNVYQNKNVVRALIGDYEDRAIRAHALGRFSDLLRAVVYHPAMLLYLDNAQNASGRINENFARELMELHTLGVDGGYSQSDVQELARILTGVGINLRNEEPRVRRELRTQYVRNGLFEFNPNRHDYGDKQFLGQLVRGSGLKEVDEAIDRLARHPATARFVSRKLALYFVSDEPSPALITQLAAEFTRSDGDIASTLAALFNSAEFTASLGRKFKDPVHYVVSAVRLAYDDSAISNAAPMINWLNRMAQPLYGRQTPDGYPLTADAWTSPAQMATRFEIAKAIAAGGGRLFRGEGSEAVERPATPQLSNLVFHQSLQPRLSLATRKALDEAGSELEWNTYLLASPEFQNR